MGGMLWQGTGSPKETEVGVAARPEVGRRGNSSPKAPHFLLPGWTFLRQAARTEQREGKKRGTGGLRLSLFGGGTEMEKTSAPGTAMWLHLRPTVGDLKLGGR